MAITYTEFELLSRVIDEHIMGRQEMLKMNQDDYAAAISFLMPNSPEDLSEEATKQLFGDAQEMIDKLTAIKPKLLSLISN